MTIATFPSNEVTGLRKRLLDLTGFDLFTSPRFIERFVCNVCDLHQTDKQTIYDAKTARHERVEIKHSNSVRQAKWKEDRTFNWQGLQGSSKQGKNVDAFILVGFNAGALRYFVFPAVAIGKRTSIAIPCSTVGKWASHEIALGKLKEMLEAVIAVNISLKDTEWMSQH